MMTDQILARTQSPVPDTSQAAIRGITNETGRNNCFLNCAVQAIWNLDSFRKSFVLLDKHKCAEDRCIFCSLLNLAANYQYHDQGPVTPDVLRDALAKTYQTDNRFQIGFMEDAAECFEGILQNLHKSLSDSSWDSLCIADECIAHRLFSMTLVEQDDCRCGATSEPLTYDQYIFYSSVADLTKSHSEDTSLAFSTLLHRQASSTRTCPAGKHCPGPARLSVSMIEKPDVFCVGLAWPNSEVPTSLIKEFADCVEVQLDLDEMFTNVVSERSNLYRLVGVMVYYGFHYFTFFFHSGVKKWLLYDDATVTEIGTQWSDVQSLLVKGKYQPLVLLYVNPKPGKMAGDGKKSVLPKAYKDIKAKQKHGLKQKLSCLSSHSPVASRISKEKVAVLREESFENLGNSPGFSQSKNILDSMMSGVEDKLSAGLTFVGLKDGDKYHKKKFINDCMKQADNQYFEAKKYLITKEYDRALDLAVDATNFYKFILSHEDTTLSQREIAQIKYETARTKARRIMRRIPTADLSDAQLSAVYHKCGLCDTYKEDEMQYCQNCTRYCVTCNTLLHIADGDHCVNCLPEYVVNGEFEEKLKQSGHSAGEVVWYDTKLSSPPPYESLRRTKCIYCGRSIVTSSDVCHFCSSLRK